MIKLGGLNWKHQYLINQIFSETIFLPTLRRVDDQGQAVTSDEVGQHNADSTETDA